MYITKRPQVVLTVKDLQAIRTTLLILDEVLDKDDDLVLDIDTSSIARTYETLDEFVKDCKVDEEAE
jgi:hypothetical protein